MKLPDSPEWARDLPERMLVTDVCRVLGVTRRTLYNWRQTGYGPSWRKIGGRYVYSREDVIRFLNEALEQASGYRA